MTARSSRGCRPLADVMRERIPEPRLLGHLWDTLPHLHRMAIAVLQPHRDLSWATTVVELSWQEIDTRDRACLIVGCRRALGLGSLVEAALR